MDEPVDRRKGGRPRSGEPKTSVSTWIPAREHDRLIRLAHQRDQSVSQTVRQLLLQRLAD
jgi:hypothetical protein